MESTSPRRVFISPRSSCAVLMFTLTVLAFATPGFAQVSFQPSIHSSPNIPTDIFQVKLSQVGKPDLITTQASSNMVSVFLNDGNGNFPAGPSATYLTGGVGVNSVVSADFDEDGSPDLATANCGNSPDPPQTPVPSSVSILFNNGDKTFKPHVDYPLPACPDSIGFLLAPSGNSLFSLVVSYGQSTLTILANDSFGTFSEHTITGPAGSILSGVSAADYNGDTLDDVAAVMSFPGNPVQQVVIFYQQGNGFGPATTVFSMQANLIAANTVGFNTTGRPDLLVPFTNAANEPPGVIAMANQGGGVFNSVKLHVDSRYLLGHKAAEGDLQGTGLHSIILPTTFLDSFNNLFGTFAVFFQTSKGAFLGPFYYAGDTFGSPGAVVVADFNGDGHTDFAAAGGEDEHLLVYRNNTSASTCSFFSNAGVHVCTPGSGGTASSPVAIAASGQGTPFPILAMKAYIDGKQVAENDFNTLNAAVSESTGTHQLAVNAWDPNDKVYQTIVNFTVGSACSPPSSAGVHICAPASGSTVSSPVAISAASNGGSAKISAMKAYIDGKQVASSTGAALTGSATEAAGSHQLVVNAWNTAGTLFQSIVNFSVK